MAQTPSEAQLTDRIRALFQGVTLGQGRGLREAEAMDNYADDEKLAECRALDEHEDWQAIDGETLNSYFDGLAFMDPAGMRFHLPAYLVLDLAGGLRQDLLFNLCYVTTGNDARYSLLNQDQKEVVRDFLMLRNTDEFCRPMVEAALEGFWCR